MLKSFIKKIRSKPRGTRDRVALGIAGTVTACIFVVWIYYMPTRMAMIADRHEDNSSPAFSQLLDEISNQFSAVKEAVPDESEREGMFDDYDTNFRGETPNHDSTSFQVSDLPTGSTSTPAIKETTSSTFASISISTSTSTSSLTSTPTSSPVVAPAPRNIRIIATPIEASSTGAEIE